VSREREPGTAERGGRDTVLLRRSHDFSVALCLCERNDRTRLPTGRLRRRLPSSFDRGKGLSRRHGDTERTRRHGDGDTFLSALRHARCGEPRPAVALLGPFLRITGLPSRSALVALPLRLAALRRPRWIVLLERCRPPPGVSAACLVAMARCFGRPFPGEPHTVLCSSKLESWRHNTVYCTPAGARGLVLREGRESRAPRCTRRGAPVGGASRGPRERCLAPAGRFPVRRVA
jgi:hypothetical protein